MHEVVCAFLITYILVLFVRMFLSWLPPGSGVMRTVGRVVFDITEPVLAPVRRVIPPVGMFDLSFTVVVFALLIVQQAVCRSDVRNVQGRFRGPGIATIPPMDVTPRELRDLDIREEFRGYNPNDVDDLLERAARSIEKLESQVRDLQQRADTGAVGRRPSPVRTRRRSSAR